MCIGWSNKRYKIKLLGCFLLIGLGYDNAGRLRLTTYHLLVKEFSLRAILPKT